MKSRIYRLILFYLKVLAKLQLKKIKPIIIGVTGSVGKTSTTAMIAAALTDKFKVKLSEKANSEIGLPLNILSFPPRSYSLIDCLWILPLALIKLLINQEKYDIYVAEMGVDNPNPPKNMSYLLSIFQPQIGVFLNVYPVHIEAFPNLNAIAQEKGKLITSLPKNGWAVLNQTDPKVISFKSLTQAKIILFNGEAQEAALAVAKVFKISKTQALVSIKKHYHQPPGRMSIIPGVKNTTLIDSSYNASRISMLLALKKLSQTGSGKKIAVLGDMRELGLEAKKEHILVAQETVKIADKIVTIGPLMKQYFTPKIKNLYQFDNTRKAAEFIKNTLIQGGETILIKGSQNTLFLEIITESLMRNPKAANELLCRRGSFWDKKRATI